MHHFHGARRLAGVALLLSLGACSGSGGDDSQTSREIVVSPQALSFAVPTPEAPTPAPQIITATFREGVANLSVLNSGLGIASITTAVSGTSAQITVTPEVPASLGPGTYNSTIAITAHFCADAACSRLEAGGSQTVTTTYQISPVLAYVAPAIAVTGIPDTAVIRGIGFESYAIAGVKFGDVAATSMTIVSNSEIRATYPALAAGTYPISLDVPSEPGVFAGAPVLTAIDPVNYAALALPWPAPVTAVRALVYDAQRGAVLTVTDAGGGELLRYPYAGGAWGPAATAGLANLQDAALSTNGSQLLALTTTQVVPIDPATLVPGAPVAAPSLPDGNFLKNLAVTNVDFAIITTGVAGSAATQLYNYLVPAGVMTRLELALNNASTGVSANGAVIGLVQGDPSLTVAPPVYTLSATSGTFTASTVTLNQNAVAPVVDRNATRLVLNGVYVFDSSFTFLGTLPDTTVALALRPDGQRVYTYDSAAGGVLSFNISATNAGAAYAPLGAVVVPAEAPGPGTKMAITPDGTTLFLAGTTQLVIQPTPVDP